VVGNKKEVGGGCVNGLTSRGDYQVTNNSKVVMFDERCGLCIKKNYFELIFEISLRKMGVGFCLFGTKKCKKIHRSINSIDPEAG